MSNETSDVDPKTGDEAGAGIAEGDDRPEGESSSGNGHPVSVSPFTFEPVDHARFPALGLGILAGRRGGAAPAVFNAANEQGVALFLAGAVTFGDISKGIDSALQKLSELPGQTREELLAADAAARRHVMELF